MGWAMLYLFVFLKLPIAALCWLVWWAVRQTPDEAGETGDSRSGYRRPHPPPRLPRAPRRGPHGGMVAVPPPRMRPVRAQASAQGRHRQRG